MNAKLVLFFLIIIISIPKFVSALEDNQPNSETKQHASIEKKDNNLQANQKKQIKNPGFENYTSNWILGKYNGGAGLFYTDSVESISTGRSAIILTENQDQKLHDLQLFTSLDLNGQTQYRISFKAQVKKACLVSISIGNELETVFEEKIILQPGMMIYGPFIFINEVNDPFQFFAINLGKTSQKIVLDDIIIQPYEEKIDVENSLLAEINTP
jgi:hypothetical protein